jgi:hypothetical protein
MDLFAMMPFRTTSFFIVKNTGVERKDAQLIEPVSAARQQTMKINRMIVAEGQFNRK